MTESIRCPYCGGLNPADAQWCGQCLRPFVAPDPPSEVPAPVPATATIPDAPVRERPPAPDLERPPPTAPITTGPEGNGPPFKEATVGAFTVGREGITWACARCGTVNPLESNHCSVCGATFAEVVRPPSKQLERDPNTTLMISLFFPGAGHAYLNLWPEAVARGLISVWAIGVTIVAALGHTGAATVLAVLFGLAAFALWVVDAHDAFRVAQHEDRQVILKGRMYLYVVLGLLLVLLAGVVVVSLHNGSSLR